MGKYILKRIGWMIVVMFGVLTIVFLLLYFTPGDPARQLLGPFATDAEVEAKRIELGLNDPLLVRYGKYIYNLVFHFDLGVSYRTGQPVVSEIMSRLPVTMAIGLAGLVISILIGITAGILSAVFQYSWIDKISNLLAVFFHSMPNFWLALELSIIFALHLKWLPPTGFKGIKYLVLPVMTLGLSGSTALFRQTRSSMLDVIRSDYIRTAKSKGQTKRVVVLHHALKNALVPIITMIGSNLGQLLCGAVVVESIFAIPGLGSYMLQAISARDYTVIQGSVFILSLSISFFNLLTDIAYSFVDPQIKAQYQTHKS